METGITADRLESGARLRLYHAAKVRTWEILLDESVEYHQDF